MSDYFCKNTDVFCKNTDDFYNNTDDFYNNTDDFYNNNDILGKSGNYYHCMLCKFKNYKKHYETHLLTKKHLRNIKHYNEICEIKNKIKNIYHCPCGKKYSHRQSLHYHRQKCNVKDQNQNPNPTYPEFENKLKMDQVNDSDMIKSLLKQNDEFKNILMEFMKNPPQQVISNVNNNITNNKQFNLQVYLNETCKDAMNLSEFVDSLVIKASELEDMGRLGYAQGISNIIIRGLNELDETKRPFHCTDKKREIIYIKENNVWEKETMSRLLLRKMIRDIAHRNFKRMPQWMLDNPSCDDTRTKKHIEYMSIVNQVMTGLGPEDDIGINKIIRNVANYSYINKCAVMLF